MKPWIGLFFVCLISTAASAKPLVVLVPGFFNSLAPGNENGPYFSRAVVETLRERSQVFVVNNLAPFGGVAENSKSLVAFLREIERQYPNESIILITHSAGGIYALQALNSSPNLHVKTVVTLAAPYEGIDFIENLGANVPGLESLVQFLQLDALKEFRLAPTAILMKSLRIPSSIRWIALAGKQSPCFLLSCAQSRKLSWVLSIAQSLMKNKSDGIVTVPSALAKNLSFPIERWNDFEIPLEHWEMVEEASLFHLIGVLDTGHIEKVQSEVFSRILDRVL